MKAADFLHKELKAIADRFPNVNIRYGYDDIIETHIVELLPLIEYNTNEELDKAWIPLSINFLEIYSNDEIAFVSSDSSLSLKNIIFEFNPKACTEENIISELFFELTKINLVYTFPTEIPKGVIIQESSTKLLFQQPSTKKEVIDYVEDLENYYSNAA